MDKWFFRRDERTFLEQKKEEAKNDCVYHESEKNKVHYCKQEWIFDLLHVIYAKKLYVW